MTGELARTALNSWHAAHGGRMVDFAGWSMPVQYGSIVEEHQACRKAVALFDVSHMGRLRFDGVDAARLLDALLTRKVLGMGLGRVRYSLMCNESGGILDDVLVYRMTDRADRPYHGLVVNASNREKIVAWIQSHLPQFGDAMLTDLTPDTAMIAVQGPHAMKLLAPLVDIDIQQLGYYTAAEAKIQGTPGTVSRTGYTGEDGCELIVPNSAAASLWETLIAGGARAAGLGARDTLRLEAAMPLYGHELNETIDPHQAGLSFAVNDQGREFVGRAALEKTKADKSKPVRIGLQLASRRVPREHFGVYSGDQSVGEITSGTFSPTLDRPIAMAYVQPASAAVGTKLTVDIRGSREPAEVVPLPFYRRAEAGST